MSLYVAMDRIQNGRIKNGVRKIISKYYSILKEAPASMSGHHHTGETIEDHLVETFAFAEHFIKEFNLKDQMADLLRAAAFLHDIGNCEIVYKGNVHDIDKSVKHFSNSWKYYESTGWSRDNSKIDVHPILSAKILGENPFEGSDIVQALVLSHMSHWHSASCLSPGMYNRELSRLAEMLCMSDYLAGNKEVSIGK